MLKKLIKINLSNLECILIFYNFAWFFWLYAFVAGKTFYMD